MRQIILDTETTGLDPKLGHRIIEIAAVEMINRRLTTNRFQQYLNPERDIDPGAMQVHGISNEFLLDKLKFADVVTDFLDYIDGAELVIHNAPFDLGFLNAELALLEKNGIQHYCPSVIDTLKLAKELHPGQKNNLDALCRRYFINNSRRILHGALLDAELLAEVYLAMTRGQESFAIGINSAKPQMSASQSLAARPELFILAATPDESAAHQALLLDINKASRGECLWVKLQASIETV